MKSKKRLFVCELSFLDNYSYHPSSKKSLFTANVKHCRKPQLDTRQRSVDHAPTDTSTSQPRYLRLREHQGTEQVASRNIIGAGTPGNSLS